ncbi:MAG: STAS domain-containing protein [Planctomycetota bacterium]
MTWEDRPDARWIILSGELDHEGCQSVTDEFRRVAQDSVHPVVVDLSSVRFVASTGLRMLLESHHALRDQGHSLKVHNLQEPVRRVFHTTGIFDAIPEFEQR